MWTAVVARPQLAARIWEKWARLSLFCYFLLGGVEKCELSTDYVIMVSKNMKTNASFYRAKL